MKAESVLEKLRKIKELAERGVGGEAENARASLQRLLRKFGISIEELSGETVKRYQFSLATTIEKRLFVQVVLNLLQSCDTKIFDVKVNGKITKKLAVNLTPAQYADVCLAFEYYKRAFRKEGERLFVAFIHKHDLFPPRSDEQTATPMSRSEAAKLAAMMAGLGEKTFQKPLARIEDSREEGEARQ